ncbi:hypothetical protein D9M69_451090 [compost metagenome]
MNHLDHRRQAVGGARGGGNDAMLGGVEQVLVDAHDHVQRALFLDRRTDDHALHALIQVGLEHGDGLHLAAGLDHQIAVRPVGVGDGLVGGDLDALAADHHAIALTARFVLPAPVHRIEVQQVGVGRGVAGRVVDADELQFGPVPGGAQRQTTDTTETVDTDFDAHVRVLWRRLESVAYVELADPVDVSRVLDGLGTQGLYLGNGIRARHPSLDQDARRNQPSAARATLAVDGEVLAGIQQAENLLLRLIPGLIEVIERYLFIRYRQLKPVQA